MNNKEYLAIAAKIQADPQSMGLPQEAAYLAQMLLDYRPIIPPRRACDNMTSIDIQEMMGAVCQLEVNAIARAMSLLGYQLYFQGISQPEWAMGHIDNIEISDTYE